nr:MAG TPA: hypothetical protein [Caudoviricetes sp.]
MRIEYIYQLSKTKLYSNKQHTIYPLIPIYFYPLK